MGCRSQNIYTWMKYDFEMHRKKLSHIIIAGLESCKNANKLKNTNSINVRKGYGGGKN